MCSFGLLCVGELTAIIGLDYLRPVAKVDKCTLHKIYCTIATTFFVGIYKPLSGSFIYHSILVKFLTIGPNITGFWDMFYVHLPLFAQFLRRIIMPQMLGFLFCRFCFLAIT